DAADAQARHVNDLVVSEDKNIHRNLLRKLVRGPTAIAGLAEFEDGRTVDDLMAIFAHSFHCMREGIFPEVDFQGQPFKSSWRRKMAGRPLLAQGILAEVRGDWAMYKQEIRSCSSSAPWRDHPWSFLELQEHMLDKSGAVSPIMAAPGISLATFEVDWLHSCDLGVAADFLGNCCFLVSKHMPGSSEEQRVASLWRDIKQWYTENQTPNQFNTITKLMIRKEARKSPKLRGKAAEIRYLIPWSVDITERLFSGYPPSSEEGACRLAAKQIQICYSQLSTENFDPKVLADSCKSFLLLYTALEDLCLLEHRWRYKPKFHLWQHMCESTQSAPSLYWTYDDEDWGGSLGRMSVRRGGKHVALGLSKTVLTKFAAQNKVPSLADLALREKSTAPFCEHFACCLCKGA
ncbi:unnamed protein product, partial [Symbiodinium natans]